MASSVPKPFWKYNCFAHHSSGDSHVVLNGETERERPAKSQAVVTVDERSIVVRIL
ncbi:hypothetical protein C481_11180 [Natrialba asiatica DSM 12278]|uniref:Uncharacterized protein n=1 Tax=Natrialba asiatica (strain ATCC 700177 / DSM 12278 / JCM 9576 / FERM P-10747 / NBRC 102637 / 172P1) TaxID=29540 RepID=M0AS65_NATA1|nr:hypothetical protein C481_11180 [Natrialba asiatica DSM 12278]